MKNTLNPIQKNLITLTAFCFALLILRMTITKSLFFGFLIWNIILAFIPFMVSSKIKKLNLNKTSKTKLITILFVWLVFLPNAPYIITDFIHLHHSKSILIWLDIFLLFSFSFTGLLFAIISLNDVFDVIRQKWNQKIATIFIISAVFLCGFGIYLGRFLRLNSWEIITSPIKVIKNSIYSFKDTTTWLVTLGFGIFIWIIYTIFKNIKTINTAS